MMRTYQTGIQKFVKSQPDRYFNKIGTQYLKSLEINKTVLPKAVAKHAQTKTFFDFFFKVSDEA